MSCEDCGRPHRGPKCEGGQVRYIAGWFPCALKVGTLREEPKDDWGVEPEPEDEWTV